MGCGRILRKGASVTQDELQHLDAELAAGRISAEEYRTRRDAALRQGGQPSTPSGGVQQQGPNSGGFPQQDPQGQPNPQQQSSPFPPAFTWGTPPAQSGQQQASSDEATQVVQNPLLSGQQPPAQQPPAQQPQQQGGSDSDSTQVVNVNQVQQPQQWPNPQPAWGPQQGWGAAESSGTPWGDSDLPPTPEHGDTSWMRQGPEVFETAGTSSKGKLIAGLSLGAVLVVGVVVAGVFYFTSSGGQEPPQAGGVSQAPQPPKPAPTTSKLPEPPAAKPAPTSTDQVLVAAPGGPPHPYNGPLDRPGLEGPKNGVLQQSVRTIALSKGMVDGWFNRTDGPPSTVLLTVRMPDQASASEVAQTYLTEQKGLAVSDELSYQGVDVMETGSGTFRTAYVAHNWAVIVEVNGPDKAAAQSLFKSVLDQQLAQTPPTVLD